MTNKLILPIIIFVVTLAGIFFWLVPLYQNWSLEKDELALIEEQIEQLKQATAKVGSFNVDQHFQELTKLNQAMPVGIGDQDLLVTLEGLALNNGLLLNSVNVNEVKDAKQELLSLQGANGAPAGAALGAGTNKRYKKITVSLDLLGDYTSFKGFLKGCEQNVRVFNLKEVKITNGDSSGSAPSGNTFKFLVDIETYYLPEN